MGGRKDPIERAAYMAEYQSRPEVIARRKAYNRTPERKKIMADTMRKAIQNPQLRARHEARWKLRREIVQGRIVRQPCEKCAEPKAHAHHEDYSKPLDVRWLCRKCHGLEHRKYKLAQEAR